MPHAFDRRSFLAGGVALGAGFVALGSSSGWAGASLTNGPGRNGISTATPKRGGSITFGMDTEEGGFDPTSARWDEGGFLYGRTVFDPIAIVTGGRQGRAVSGAVDHLQPGLHRVHHHPAPGHRLPRRHAAELRRPAAQPPEATVVHPDGAGLPEHRIVADHRPALGVDHHEGPLGAVSLRPGPGPDGVRGSPVHAQQQERHHEPGGYGALHLRRVDPQQPFHRDGQSPLLAQGAPLSELHHLQADHQPVGPRRRPGVGDDRHHAHQHAAIVRELPAQLQMVLRGQQRCHSGTA